MNAILKILTAGPSSQSDPITDAIYSRLGNSYPRIWWYLSDNLQEVINGNGRTLTSSSATDPCNENGGGFSFLWQLSGYSSVGMSGYTVYNLETRTLTINPSSSMLDAGTPVARSDGGVQVPITVKFNDSYYKFASTNSTTATGYLWCYPTPISLSLLSGNYVTDATIVPSEFVK